MSILLKNKHTLSTLLASFNLQEILIVNQNLSQSWHLLTIPPEQILLAMKEKKVDVSNFLNKKCLPLTRFFLADASKQKAVFLDKDALAQLFISLPAVEAFVFKQQINRAQKNVQQTNLALQLLLAQEVLANQHNADDLEAEVESSVLNITQHIKIQRLQAFASDNKNYENCFYYLKNGELSIVQQEDPLQMMLLYTELSPLQQLSAQGLFNQRLFTEQEKRG